MNGKKILSVLFGALTSLGIFLLLALVLTWLVTREMLPVGQAPKAVWAALALAVLLGALLADGLAYRCGYGAGVLSGAAQRHGTVLRRPICRTPGQWPQRPGRGTGRRIAGSPGEKAPKTPEKKLRLSLSCTKKNKG